MRNGLAASSYMLLEGTLTDLHVGIGKENLLQQIDKHYRQGSLLTGIGSAAGDMFGQMASSAMVAMYDGEDTQNFACLIDGRLLYGQFGGAEMLKVGNRIKAVASKNEDAFEAHAIMDEQLGLMWIGYPLGSVAERKANFRLARWLFVFVMVCVFLLAVFDGLEGVGVLETLLWGAAAASPICFGMAIWSSVSLSALSDPSTNMMRLLGFKSPERVNLNGYRVSIVEASDHLKNGTPRPRSMDMGEYQTRNVFCYRRAIEDGKVSLISVDT